MGVEPENFKAELQQLYEGSHSEFDKLSERELAIITEAYLHSALHAAIEERLSISQLSKETRRWINKDIGFFQRISLAEAIGLIDSLDANLFRKILKVRNVYGHRVIVDNEQKKVQEAQTELKEAWVNWSAKMQRGKGLSEEDVRKLFAKHSFRFHLFLAAKIVVSGITSEFGNIQSVTRVPLLRDFSKQF